MTSIRWQLRWLFLGLMVFGVAWIHLSNYVSLDLTPLQQPPQSLLVFWSGALAIGLLLDALAGFHLRRFFAAVARMQAGQALTPAEAGAAAAPAVHFPWRAAATLLGAAAVLTALFHWVDYDFALGEALADPGERSHILNLVTQEMTETLVIALLLYTNSRRILQPAVAALQLQEPPAGPRLSVGARVVLVVLAQLVTLLALFLNSPDVPPRRMLWLYIPLGVVFLLTALLVADDTGRDLSTIAGRLRMLAAGLRPDLFHRLAVTGQDEVAELVAAFNVLQDRVEGEFRAIERDLRAARTIQTELLPRAVQPPPGWDLAARLLPAQEVGGDFYDVIPLADGRLGLAVGDAVGKGLPAALLMASTVSLIRSHAPRHDRPGEVLAAVNRLLAASLPPRAFVTTIYAVVDLESREVTYATAGHLPPAAGGRQLEPIPAPPLGIDPDFTYPERTFTLGPSEPLLLFSDGLVEAPDGAGGMLGLGPIRTVMAAPGLTAGERVQQLLAAPGQGNQWWIDDITVLVLAAPAELVLELPSHLGTELQAAEAADRFARDHGFSRRAEAVATCVSEVCLNAITHGHGLQANRPVVVRLRAGPGWLEAAVRDGGPAFALPERAPVLAEQMQGHGPMRGWGLHLVRTLADEASIEPAQPGKLVRLRFRGKDGQGV